MEFTEAMCQALTRKDLTENFDRLTGSKVTEVVESFHKGGINLEIDKATGFAKTEFLKFADFFYIFIWNLLPKE